MLFLSFFPQPISALSTFSTSISLPSTRCSRAQELQSYNLCRFENYFQQVSISILVLFLFVFSPMEFFLCTILFNLTRNNGRSYRELIDLLKSLPDFWELLQLFFPHSLSNSTRLLCENSNSIKKKKCFSPIEIQNSEWNFIFFGSGLWAHRSTSISSEKTKAKKEMNKNKKFDRYQRRKLAVGQNS